MTIPTKNGPRFTPAEISQTQEQLDIQLSRDKLILIEANAGAAKTTTLAIRTGEALARGLLPSEILILLFTSEARDVMRKRLVEIGIAASIASQVSVKTFDDFAADVLNVFDGYQPKRINTASELKPYVIAAIEKVNARYNGSSDELELSSHNIALSQFIDTQLSIKASMSEPREYEGMEMEEVAYLAGVTLTHWLTFLEYERLRYGDFDEAEFRGVFDATYDLARRLTDSPELKAALPSYRLLLCDELHDLNEAAFRILMELLSAGKTNFLGAGDKDQVIHATLGADAQYLQHRFDNAGLGRVARLPLTATFRYGPNLASAVGKLKQKPSTSPLQRLTKIEQGYYREQNECAKLVVDSIADWQENQKGSCAILIRDRHQSITIENALMQAGIGYQSLHMQKYLQRGEILFLRGMIAIALKNLAAVQSLEIRGAIVEALVTYGEVTLDFDPEEDESVPLKIEKIVEGPLEYAMSYLVEYPEMLNEFFKGQILRSKSNIRRRMVDVIEFVESLPQDTKAEEALSEICKRMDVESLLKRIHVYPYEASVVKRSIDGFIHYAATSGRNLKDFSEWLGEAENFSPGKNSYSVILECVANSKGMEFDHVIVPLLELGQFPDPKAELKQEENLFYVGVTRAKHALTLIMPKDPAKRSPFVGRMAFSDIKVDENKAIPKPVQAPSRTDLKVPYAAKDEAKSLGAKWDKVRKVWYVEPSVDLQKFKRWIK